jgi:hypothetical protein
MQKLPTQNSIVLAPVFLSVFAQSRFSMQMARNFPVRQKSAQKKARKHSVPFLKNCLSQACKPSSVVDGHLSRPAVTSQAHAITWEHDGPPYDHSSINLAPGGVYRADKSPGRW